MSVEKLVRWSGLALLVGGVLSPLSILIHPAQETAEVILSQTWREVAAHVLGTSSIVFVLLGLVGLYAVHADRVGRLGLAGFLLAFLGNVLLATSSNYGYIAPVLAARAPALLAEVNAYGPELGLDTVMVITYLLGFVLFGIAVARAGVVPRWGGVLISLGVPLFFLGAFLAAGRGLAGTYWIAIAGQVLFGVGLIGLGWPLWSGRQVTAGRQPAPCAEPA